MTSNKVITIAAALEPTMSRRRLLTGIAAASASVAVVATPAPAKSAAASTAENPELLQAHAELLAARAEHEQAKTALEWLVDEWRHLWPLAPEDLLGCANAHSGYGAKNIGERDIAGRYLLRDTTVLTKRLTAKQRAKGEKTCFDVLTAAGVEDNLSYWQETKPTGRTERSRARNRATKEEMIRKYRELLPVAQAYEAETARLREASGVELAKRRVTLAEAETIIAASKVCRAPAFTHEGLSLQAAALSSSPIFSVDHTGILGDLARFIQAVQKMGGRA
ncbi:hypothetical protein ABCW43_02405 [Neorhizobium sp. IRAMC:178]|uniref:hypothetical protein n=1 Tax=Neorhizobium tunisiense TaxID=3144793 RepID=UPI0031F62C57